MPNKPPTYPTSHMLAHLRSLLPRRDQPLTYRDALRIAQQQAEELHHFRGVLDVQVPDSIITSLPQLHIELVDSPISSLRFWDAAQQQWVIQLAASDTDTTRRFHLAYEFKQILDHNRRHRLYRGDQHHTTACQAERAARHFAGLLLVPSVALADAWTTGIRDITTLATLFAVDATVVTARLAQIGVPS
ncbi:ImmA/IrrE family metallo-endopeptidase [Nocardia bovistercoris]|uniref:ImmA/IrrE family metallo-endopeptidase n=1 Tax=Nocardia bovistercoris TaxID=2785916 RepID=A0A931IHW8_9NOCA|nr:ImmA/IrrE family metallo-endopeptidase [Nocardia bovistercoris]MBH0779928.1 ImmA/IrrE family metallo-endopeptidase [Nocardia bovistercoris]